MSQARVLELLHAVAAKVPRLLRPDTGSAAVRFLATGQRGAQVAAGEDGFDDIIGIDDALAFDSVRRSAVALNAGWSDDESSSDGSGGSSDEGSSVASDIVARAQTPTLAPADAEILADHVEQGGGSPRTKRALLKARRRARAGLPDSASLWRSGFGSMPVAVVTQAPDGAVDLADGIAKSFDFRVMCTSATPLASIAAEVRRLVDQSSERQRVAREAALLERAKRRAARQPNTRHKKHRAEAAVATVTDEEFCSFPRREASLVVVVNATSLGSDTAADGLRRLVSEVLALRAQYQPAVVEAMADTTVPALHVSLAVVVSTATDAIRVRDAVVAPLRSQVTVEVIDSHNVVEDAFGAFLFETLVLFPVILTAEALEHLRRTWEAAWRLTDVVRNYHTLLTHGGATCAGPKATHAVQLCVDAATEARDEAERTRARELQTVNRTAYSVQVRAFEALYVELCAGNADAIRGPEGSQRHELAQWMRTNDRGADGTMLAQRLGLQCVGSGEGKSLLGGSDPVPLVTFPTAPIPTSAPLATRLQQLTTDDAGHDAATAVPLSQEPHVADHAKVLWTLQQLGGRIDQASWIPFEDVGKRTGMSEARLLRALFELRTRHLAAVNLAKRTARAVTL